MTVVRAGEAKLMLMLSSSGAVHRFAVASDATISRDGKYVKLEEVSLGDFAMVSIKEPEVAPVVTVIVALSPFKGHGDIIRPSATVQSLPAD